LAAEGLAERFSLTNAPDGSEAIQITLYADDVSFEENSSSCPRSELSGQSINIDNNIVYTATFDQ